MVFTSPRKREGTSNVPVRQLQDVPLRVQLRLGRGGVQTHCFRGRQHGQLTLLRGA